jgi:hypothetical protein
MCQNLSGLCLHQNDGSGSGAATTNDGCGSGCGAANVGRDTLPSGGGSGCAAAASDGGGNSEQAINIEDDVPTGKRQKKCTSDVWQYFTKKRLVIEDNGKTSVTCCGTNIVHYYIVIFLLGDRSYILQYYNFIFVVLLFAYRLCMAASLQMFLFRVTISRS